MEGNILLKTKKKFIFNLCRDILIVMLIILIVLWVVCLIIMLTIIVPHEYLMIVILTILSGTIFAGIYDWIELTWKKSREQIENE